MVLNKGKRKQERKGNRIITLDGERIARRSNDNMTLVSETSHKQNHCGNHIAALNEKESKRMFGTVSCSAVVGDKKFEFNLGIKRIR